MQITAISANDVPKSRAAAPPTLDKARKKRYTGYRKYKERAEYHAGKQAAITV
jgi:hypothetical protein